MESLISGDTPSDEDLTSMLELAFEQARHLPTTGLYSSLCNLLALQYIHTCPLKAAYYLTEGMVVTFRHQSLVNCSRKIRYKCHLFIFTYKSESQHVNINLNLHLKDNIFKY